MSNKITQKQLKHDEFVDAAFDFEQWIEANWKPVAGIAAGAIVVGLLAYGWVAFDRRSNAKSAAELGEVLGRVDSSAGTPAAAASDWSAALPKLEQLAKSGSDAAGTAEFYRGVALARGGKLGEAIPVLEAVAAKGGVLGDIAKAKVAWALEETKETDRSIALWKEIAADTDSAIPPDVALYHQADLLAGQGKVDEAKAVLTELLAKHQEGTALADARALQAALDKPGAARAATTGTP